MPSPVTSLVDCFAEALRDAIPATPAPRLAAPQLPGAAAALTALALGRLHPHATVLAVAPGPTDLEALHADLLAFAREAGVEPLFFPALEGDDQSSDPELAGVRFATLRTLCSRGETSVFRIQNSECGANVSPLQPSAFSLQPCILATCVHALQQPVPDPAAVEKASTHLRVGAE